MKYFVNLNLILYLWTIMRSKPKDYTETLIQKLVIITFVSLYRFMLLIRVEITKSLGLVSGSISHQKISKENKQNPWQLNNGYIFDILFSFKSIRVMRDGCKERENGWWPILFIFYISLKTWIHAFFVLMFLCLVGDSCNIWQVK